MDTLESSELALQAKAPAALQLEEATGAEWVSLRPATNNNKGGGAQGRVGELAARRAGGKQQGNNNGNFEKRVTCHKGPETGWRLGTE